MKTIFKLVQIMVMFTFVVVACSPQITQPPTVVDVENDVRVLPTATMKPLETKPVPSEIPTDIPIVNTNTPLPAPTDVLSLIGTPLPGIFEVIGINNYSHLRRIGQWGRGSIQGVGFTPDGKSSIAISEMGWSIYNMDALDQPPLWVGFDKPDLFNQFYFSADGTMVKFIDFEYPTNRVYTRTFPHGETGGTENNITWLTPAGETNYNNVVIRSPDGTQVFKGTLAYEYNEAMFSEETSIREMYDDKQNLLYTLRDDAPYVTYSDRNGPEGCDISVFSPCGNALMAVATTPIKALFSADGKTFSVLYDTPSLYTGIMRAYSFIRIYDSSDGSLLGSIGGFTKPIQDFGYSPDGRMLVVGFVDGSIVLWDIAKEQSVYGTRHMNAPAWELTYSPDSKYLLIQRAEELEVRLTTNGALRYRFDMAEFAVAPKQNLIALGDDEGNIQIRDLDSGESIRTIKAHDDRIYSIAFSADGLYLASSGQDCDIKLWDLKTGELLHYFEETAVDAYEIGMTSRIFSTHLEFIPDTNMLVGFGSWGTVVNWNVNSGATNYVIQSAALEYYNGMITIKPHFPEYFDVDQANNSFYINENGFNLSTGESQGTYESPVNLPEGCSPVGPQSVDRKLLFTMGYDSREGEICVLNAETLELLDSLHVQWATWAYLSPDGRQLIVTAGSGIVYVFQIA